MKVLMISTSFPKNAEDWRGRFIFSLVTALGRSSQIQLDLWAPPGQLPAGVSSVVTPGERKWLQRLSSRGGIAHLLRGQKLTAILAAAGLMRRLFSVYRRQPLALVHVNWLQNAVPLWGTRTPAIIGVLGTDFGLLRLPGMTTLLRSVFRQRKTVLAPNAEWMVPKLQRLFGDVAKVHCVPFGIDDAWFRMQRDRPNDGRQRWVAVTRLTRAKIGDLFDWGSGLFNDARELHLFGPMQEDIELPAWVHYHGPTHPGEMMTRWFPVATGLLTLSRHDEGRPQVMLEAMAAGLPVVASDIAAHRNLLQDYRTGRLVATRSQLADALDELEDSTENVTVGNAARAAVQEAIGSWDDCAGRFIELYVETLGRSRFGNDKADQGTRAGGGRRGG